VQHFLDRTLIFYGDFHIVYTFLIIKCPGKQFLRHLGVDDHPFPGWYGPPLVHWRARCTVGGLPPPFYRVDPARL
jgi:hypothetical protein